jgi:hypothetical protein
MSTAGRLTRSIPFPGGLGALAAVDGTGWIVGQGPGGGLVSAVSVDTLAVGAPLRGLGEQEAELVGVGDRSLFVRVGNGAGTVLCLDGRTGARRQSFPGLRGTVVATHGTALVVDLTGPPTKLPLAGCAA